MSIVSWRSDVNKEIIDSTTITTGEGGWKEDSTDSGIKQRYATSIAVPDRYSVTMDFNWDKKDVNGNSEYDKFKIWYKYVHQMGANPFWFDSIDRFNIRGPVVNEYNESVQCQYRITSAPNFSKYGLYMRCTMTWEEVYSGAMEVPDEDLSITNLAYENGKIYISLNSISDYDFTEDSFTLQYKVSGGTSFNNFSIQRISKSGHSAIYTVTPLSSGTYYVRAALSGSSDFTQITIGVA